MRQDYGRLLRPFVSQDYILKHIFKFTDEEIPRLNPLAIFTQQVSRG